ncbi:MAG: carotenoid oxygenase family protein [Sandaracinaceae bacterium]
MLHPRVPRSLVRTERTEHDALPLDVIEGALPKDLTGHLFVVAPASTVNAKRRGNRLAGDGLVCRFDLGPDRVTLTSRIPRTPDLIADALTAHNPRFNTMRFIDAGLVRIGRLGSRDFANTGFVTINVPGEPRRLCLTYDAGRPIEIDPASLRFITPVGERTEWRAEVLADSLFPVVLSPAHPAFDPSTGEFISVNYGRGVFNVFETVPVVGALRSMPLWLQGMLDRAVTALAVNRGFRRLEGQLERWAVAADRRLEAFLEKAMPSFVPDTFTDLVRWDRYGKLERWRLVMPDGRGVSIRQSVHQVCVTREHIIFLETGFKIGLQSGLDDPIEETDIVERSVRALVTRPQIAQTVLYIVRRDALDTDAPRGPDGVRRVPCVAARFPLEADHFVADYDDEEGQLIVHIAHSPATDLSEWIRPYDVSAYDHGPIAAELHGLFAVGPMDVGRFGRYVIDARTGAVIQSQTVADDRTTWALALYAGNGLNTVGPLPERIEQIYWCSEGCFPELLTEFVFNLYEDYPHRLASIDSIRAMGSVGRPSAVHRVDTRQMTIADRYVLPDGVMAGSLQFVPHGAGPTDGYLVGTVYTDPRTELWIFDAADLARGPVTKLASDRWNVGFSLHTAWLDSLERVEPDYRITPEDELRDPLARLTDRDLGRALSDEIGGRVDSD